MFNLHYHWENVLKRYIYLLNTIVTFNFFFLRESGEETCNFRQFVRTLAHFRPYEPSKENPLNTREKKLQCMLGYIYLKIYAKCLFFSQVPLQKVKYWWSVLICVFLFLFWLVLAFYISTCNKVFTEKFKIQRILNWKCWVIQKMQTNLPVNETQFLNKDCHSDPICVKVLPKRALWLCT